MANELAWLHDYLAVGAMLFGIGLVGFLSRRNMIVMFLSIEMMLQGVSLSLVAWGRYHNDLGGQMLVLFMIAVAACEAAVALAMVLTLFERTGKLDIAAWHALREADQPPLEEEELPPEPADHRTQRPIGPGQRIAHSPVRRLGISPASAMASFRKAATCRSLRAAMSLRAARTSSTNAARVSLTSYGRADTVAVATRTNWTAYSTSPVNAANKAQPHICKIVFMERGEPRPIRGAAASRTGLVAHRKLPAQASFLWPRG